MKKSMIIGAAVLPALPLLNTFADNKGEKTDKPNIVLIIADDLGFGDVSAYGSKTISTPNIDKLANGGVCFQNGYATSATSTPSRYAMFTGMYPWKNKNAHILPGDAPLLIKESQPTLPKMLQSAGYTTAAIGKWHLGMGEGHPNWNVTVKPGANQIGFDYSCLIAATNDRVPTVYVENGNVVGLEKSDPIEVSYRKNFGNQKTGRSNPELCKMKWAVGHNGTIVNGIPRIGFMKGGEKARWVDESMADYFVDKVSTFIDDNKEKPFFLYYGLHQPHVPRAPHQRFVGSSGMGPRGDAIIEADWCVGEVIKKLKKEKLLKNTIIIFSSDNGPVLNDGYYDEAFEKLGSHKPTGGLRGGKYSLLEGGTHVPFFLYWKGTIKPTKSKAIVSQLDFFSSLGKLVGAKVPANLDSENHLDAFLGKSQEGREKYVIEAIGKLAYRQGDYVLIPAYKGGPYGYEGNERGIFSKSLLFNVEKDPTQINDISFEFPQIKKELTQEFMKITKGYYHPIKKK